MNSISKYIWGIVLIVIGVIIGINSLGIASINIFFKGWWTLFIIVPCFIGLFSKKDFASNAIGLVIGIALLLGVRDIVKFEIITKLIIPFILVAIGLSIVFSEKIKSGVTEKVNSVRENDCENIVATFASQSVNKSNEDFKGANLDAVFGGIDLDLRGASLDKETVIKSSVIFGGIDIMLPQDVNVKIKSTPIFGGVSNKIINSNENEKVIYIDALCLFGGIEIK